MLSEAAKIKAMAEALSRSERDNGPAFIVDPEDGEVMKIEDYSGDPDPEFIFYCGDIYEKA